LVSIWIKSPRPLGKGTRTTGGSPKQLLNLDWEEGGVVGYGLVPIKKGDVTNTIGKINLSYQI